MICLADKLATASNFDGQALGVPCFYNVGVSSWEVAHGGGGIQVGKPSPDCSCYVFPEFGLRSGLVFADRAEML